MSDHPPQDPAHIGKTVFCFGWHWQITGINYLGSYDIERQETRANGVYDITSTCVLGLPEDHPHFAELVSE